LRVGREGEHVYYFKRRRGSKLVRGGYREMLLGEVGLTRGGASGGLNVTHLPLVEQEGKNGTKVEEKNFGGPERGRVPFHHEKDFRNREKERKERAGRGLTSLREKRVSQRKSRGHIQGNLFIKEKSKKGGAESCVQRQIGGRWRWAVCKCLPGEGEVSRKESHGESIDTRLDIDSYYQEKSCRLP